MLQPNCICLENHNDLMLLPNFSIKEPAGKSVLLPSRHIEGCSFWKKTVLVKSDQKKTCREVGHTFLSISCSTWQSSVWWSWRWCLAFLAFYLLLYLEVTGQRVSLSQCMCCCSCCHCITKRNHNKQKTSKKPQQIIQLEFFHWYESFPVIKLQSKCCSQALTNDCFMTVL